MLLSWALVVVVVVVAGLLLYRQNRRALAANVERAHLASLLALRDATLGSAPAALYLFRPDGGETFTPGALAALGDEGQGFAAILDRFRRSDAAALDLAVTRLRTGGTEFALSAALEAGGALDIGGRRLVGSDSRLAGDAVWFSDAAAREAAERERQGLRALIDALPFPIWRRRESDMRLIDGNRAYAAAVDAPGETAIAEGREVAGSEAAKALATKAKAAGSASDSRHVVVAGSRRWMELMETRLDASGELLGFARDLTDLEAVQAELKRHIAAHAAVLERIAVAIAIYGPDRRLAFFNTSFAHLWRLEEDWLATHPY